VAIVTGASRGIGASIADRLAADGYAVVVNYHSNADKAAEVVERIVAAGGQACAVQADVSNAADISRLFQAAAHAFGGVDCVVVNAGLGMPTPTALADTGDATFDSIMAVNVRGAFLVLREAARRVRDGGRIVAVSTTLVATCMPGYAAYASAKAAVEVMVKIMAKELGPRGVVVNAVAPGPVGTDLFYAGKTQEQVARSAAMAPQVRAGLDRLLARQAR
jgi:3-oxoacyl-[acyl-carrier protein] reductase